MNNQFGNNMSPQGNNQNGRSISYSVGGPGPKRPNNTPPITPMMNNGKNNKNYKTLLFVGIGVMCFVFLFILLDRTGVINLKKEEPKQEEKQETKPEEKKVEEAIPVEDKKPEPVIEEDTNVQQMKRLCVNRDNDGNYNTDNIVEREKQIAQLPENTSPLDVWNLLQGAVFCKNHVCYWYKEGGEHLVYAYSCNTNKNETATFEELWDKIEAESMLSLACKNLDSQGNLTTYHIEGMSCSYYVCNLTYNGKEYRRECNNSE